MGEAVTRRLQKVKRILVEEAGGGCAVCAYKRSVVNLHFHHVDPSRKSFGISVALGKSLAAYREEAKKCVLVCANCHGEIEARLIPSPPAGATFASYGANRLLEAKVLRQLRRAEPEDSLPALDLEVTGPISQHAALGMATSG